MTTKERTLVFNLCVIVFNIVLGLTVEAIVLIGLMFFLTENPNLAKSMFSQIAIPIFLLLGLIAAMAISTYAVGWVIRKFHLEDKLDQKVISRYQKKNSL